MTVVAQDSLKSAEIALERGLPAIFPKVTGTYLKIGSRSRLSFQQAKRACLPAARSEILLKAKKDSGQAGMTRELDIIKFQS